MAKTATADTAAAETTKAAATETATTTAATHQAAETATTEKATTDTAAAETAGTKPKSGEAATDGTTPDAGGAPERYALRIPEGGAVDATDVAEIEKSAREEQLTNEQAQARLDLANTLLVEQSQRFAAELMADPDYGGAKLAETQRLAKIAIAAVRPDGHPRRAAFQRILDKSGAGNHIEIASFFADLGKQLAEDVPVSGSPGGGPDRTKPLANRLYPDMK